MTRPFDLARFRDALDTRRLGRHLVHMAVVGSTNDEAAAALRSDPKLPDGAVFVAERQLAGRGTSGNVWESAAGGLWVSFVLFEPLAAAPLPFLPAVALIDVLGARGLRAATLKWPNDVLVDGRKIAGVLIESERAVGGRQAWIVGVGVNVGLSDFPPPLVGRATSLALELGRSVPREALLADWLAAIERHESAATRAGYLVEAWAERSTMLGQPVVVERSGRRLFGTAAGLTPEGHLRVTDDEGHEHVLVSASDLDLRLPRVPRP